MPTRSPSALLVSLLAAAILSACGGGGYHQHPVTSNDVRQNQDRVLAEQVRRALAADVRVGAETLTVTAVEGTVWLGGTPKDLRARDLALRTAERVPGVRRVVNNMVFN